MVFNVDSNAQNRERERERERERSVLVFFSLKGEKNARKREIFSQPFFAGVLGAVVRSRRGDDIVVFSVRAVLLLLMPMPMLVSSSSSSPSRALLSLMTLTPLQIFLDRTIQKRKSNALPVQSKKRKLTLISIVVCFNSTVYYTYE